MADIPHRPGFCINCGNQTAIRTPNGIITGLLPDTQVVWLKLENDSGVKHFVGTLMICGKCDISKVDCEEIKDNLCDTPGSGVTHEDAIWSDYPKKSIELVQRMPPPVFK